MAEYTRMHATSVALNGQGLLIVGASGSGKSSLALKLMSLGCTLISDDQTDLTRRGDVLWAAPPSTIKGMVEARGVGLLKADYIEAGIAAVVDLDQSEQDRLPRSHVIKLLGLQRPCLHSVKNDAWPAALVHYLKHGRREPK